MQGERIETVNNLNGKKVKIDILPQEEGMRLDAIISERLKDLSRSKIQKLILEGGVFRLVGEEAMISKRATEVREKKEKVKAGETYMVFLPEEKSGEILPEPLREDVNIVYEDDHIIVIDKPRNMVVHPGAGNEEGTLLAGLLHHIGPALKTIGDLERPGIVHRIDKDTSGLLVVAKSQEAYESLRKQFDDHSASRVYIGLCYNNIKADELTIDANLDRDPNNRTRFAVVKMGGRNAITHIKVLKRYGNYTLFEAHLETGRTHQIRVHMASIGHPLVGDKVYGPRVDKLKMGGQILHAKELELTHPITGERMKFESPEPSYFKKALVKIDDV